MIEIETYTAYLNNMIVAGDEMVAKGTMVTVDGN